MGSKIGGLKFLWKDSSMGWGLLNCESNFIRRLSESSLPDEGWTLDCLWGLCNRIGNLSNKIPMPCADVLT